MAKPKRPGPKPRGGTATGVLAIRVTDRERTLWTTAAERESLTLSDWLRAAAELAIARGATR